MELWVVSVNKALNGIVWGPAMLVLLVGTGIFYTFRLRFFQVFRFRYVWKNTIALLFQERQTGRRDANNVSPFQAVTTALASCIGVGNIAGVAGAVAAGGPGAIFWMWVSAFFGMATKYAEIVLAVKYRQVSPSGAHFGGPMYYIEKGLGQKWLAALFALFGGLACFGIGNMTQASEIAAAVETIGGTRPIVTGLITSGITAAVIFGGIKRIGKVTEILVPVMALFYVISGALVIATHIYEIPAVFWTILSGAFSFQAVGGGIFGYAILAAMRQGIARGVFSNEAGLGSAPIAHAASSERNPVRQAMWGIIEVFIDTFLICSITGLIIVLSGLAGVAADASGGLLTAGALTAAAFDMLAPIGGGMIVRLALILFALSTIFGWFYYGERCWAYLTHNNRVAMMAVKLFYVIFVAVGATGNLGLMWDIADTLNGMMAIPNLIALLGLSGVVIKTTRNYFNGNKTR